MSSSVAIVDDHQLIRRGFASAIGESADLTVIWTAETIAEATEHLRRESPKVIIIDLQLADGRGMDLIRMVQKNHANTKVLVSSMRDEKIYAGRCIKAGASGFISKSEPVNQLIAAIKVILDGNVYLSEQMTARVLKTLGEPSQADGIDSLSDRELQVLELIGVGKDTKSIAKEMHISPKTVDSFRERIKTKLQLSNATELIHFAVVTSL